MTPTNMYISVTADVLEKRAYVEHLRKHYTEVYARREDMISHEHDTLIFDYTKMIGRFIYENFKLDVEVRALRMKCELAQAMVNRCERPVSEDIEAEVARRLVSFNQMIEEQAAAVKASEEAIMIPAHDCEEMRALYRIIVKRLHPDLHPDQSDERTELFIIAQTAYRDFCLSKLREIVLRLQLDDTSSDIKPETIDETIERLSCQIKDIEAEIARMEATFPFNMREKINDEQWVADEQQRLKEEYDSLMKTKEIYQQRYEILITL